ncbi:MAG: hypothetical protein HY706_19835 [Candidatus Hydrogenedentes bacterium]|nr:hypothetical protein [Candidatus Hydrogenedentota bacterium]
MEATIVVAIISASASIAVATFSFVFSKWAERRAALQQRKLAHYQELLNAISDLAIDGTDKNRANQRFATAANTIALVAPQYVIKALMQFHDEVKYSNPNKSAEGHDKALKKLLLAIRTSLQLPFQDDPYNFDFHLIGSAPRQMKDTRKECLDQHGNPQDTNSHP